MAQIVKQADTPEGRKDALECKLDAGFKKDDTAAVFAKAQIQMQEDPRAALATLEQIKLDKVLAPIADEARAQRAMIHLMLGETDEARTLVDAIDMSRHKDPKTRATMAAITGEAWARSGQAKKGVEMLETFDPEDDVYADLRPQLLRARAFAYAWASDTKQMKATLRKLQAINVQYLMGFITKKKNPMGRAVARRASHAREGGVRDGAEVRRRASQDGVPEVVSPAIASLQKQSRQSAGAFGGPHGQDSRCAERARLLRVDAICVADSQTGSRSDRPSRPRSRISAAHPSTTHRRTPPTRTATA